jgi:tetratricopeptide (TPR) repeat protein
MENRSFRSLRIVFAGAVCLFTSAAVAQPDLDWQQVLQRCSDHEHPKPAILACSLILAQKGLNRDGQKGIYADRGMAYLWDKNYPAAVADFTKVIDLSDKTSDSGYVLRANAYAAAGDYDKAFADFGRAIAIDPRDANAYSARGDAYNDKGDLAGAHADFMKAGDVASADSPRSGNAITYYDKAAKVDPHDAKAFNGAGRAWLDAYGDDKEAIPDFDAAIAIDPQYGEAYANRCVARVLSGSDLPRARADCDKALALGQDKDARVYYARGLAKQKAGDVTGDADLTIAKAMQPNVAEVFAKK